MQAPKLKVELLVYMMQVNISMMIGAVLSWGMAWPLIHNRAGSWYPAGLPSHSFRGAFGCKPLHPPNPAQTLNLDWYCSDRLFSNRCPAIEGPHGGLPDFKSHRLVLVPCFMLYLAFIPPQA